MFYNTINLYTCHGNLYTFYLLNTPINVATSQAQAIQLLKTQVLKRGKYESCRQYSDAQTGRCETFSHSWTIASRHSTCLTTDPTHNSRTLDTLDDSPNFVLIPLVRHKPSFS